MALIPQYTTMPRGVVGTMANMETNNARTGMAATSFTGGVPVTFGTAEGSVQPIAEATKFIGIALNTVDMQGTPLNDGSPTFKVGDTLGVCDMGAVFVLAGTGVREGGQAYYDAATRKYHGAAATGLFLLPGVEFDGAAADGEPVAVRIRLTPGDSVVNAEA